jgi:site-specific recombinase XerD
MTKKTSKTIKLVPSAVISVNGESMTATEWAKKLGTPVQTIISRVKRGWSVQEAVTTPPKAEGSNKGEKMPVEPLTPTEMNSLLKANNKGVSGLRNRALIVLGWRAGLRCSEALSLMTKDLDPENHTIRVLHGKGDKARTVGLDETSWVVLEQWRSARVKLGLGVKTPLFCTLQGKALNARYVRALMNRLAAEASIEKHVHFHGLRHTHAFELANEGTPLHIVQQQLGHANLAVTSRYISHLNPQETVNRMKSRSWSSDAPASSGK